MRIDPKPKPVNEALDKKVRTEYVTKYVALALAFLSVFYFFIKLLFL